MARPRKRRAPKAKGKKRGNAKEAIVLIPLTYNDGTQVSWRTIERIRDEIFIAFRGWTTDGTVKGAYRMRAGQKRVEDLLKMSVILDESQVPELEAMVARWCVILGQETMLLKIADYQIKFIFPQGEAEEQ